MAKQFSDILFIITVVLLIGIVLVLPKYPSSHAEENISNLVNFNETGNATNLKTYNGFKFGMSFNYPFQWNLEEKQSRFDSGMDVSVSNGSIRFSASKVIDRPKDNPLKLSGLLESTRLFENDVAKTGEDSVIEETTIQPNKIGGEKAAAFIVKHDDGVSAPTGIQTFIVFHKGDGYMLIFRAPVETFDSPGTQDMLNRILHSFRFLE